MEDDATFAAALTLVHAGRTAAAADRLASIKFRNAAKRQSGIANNGIVDQSPAAQGIAPCVTFLRQSFFSFLELQGALYSPARSNK